MKYIMMMIIRNLNLFPKQEKKRVNPTFFGEFLHVIANNSQGIWLVLGN